MSTWEPIICKRLLSDQFNTKEKLGVDRYLRDHDYLIGKDVVFAFDSYGKIIDVKKL